MRMQYKKRATYEEIKSEKKDLVISQLEKASVYKNQPKENCE